MCGQKQSIEQQSAHRLLPHASHLTNPVIPHAVFLPFKMMNEMKSSSDFCHYDESGARFISFTFFETFVAVGGPVTMPPIKHRSYFAKRRWFWLRACDKCRQSGMGEELVGRDFWKNVVPVSIYFIHDITFWGLCTWGNRGSCSILLAAISCSVVHQIFDDDTIFICSCYWPNIWIAKLHYWTHVISC